MSIRIRVFDNYGHEWEVDLDTDQNPLEDDEAYALADQAALEAANVSWEVVT